jgi:fido (protein-threonine AMPylation protein)
MLVRDYFADLNVRLAEMSAGRETLLLETLAFAEGRLLFIHPFSDFNGRATRLLLAEILRRQDLPPVELAPDGNTDRENYIRALEAADTFGLDAADQAVARTAGKSMRSHIATMEADPTKACNQDDATDFIRLNALRLKVAAKVQKKK